MIHPDESMYHVIRSFRKFFKESLLNLSFMGSKVQDSRAN